MTEESSPPPPRVLRSDPPRSRSYAGYRTTFQQRLSRQAVADKIELLPCTAESFLQDNLEKFGWKGKLETIMAGTRDEKSPLAALRPHESTLVREIYSFIGNQWAKHVKLTVPASLVGTVHVHKYDGILMQFDKGRGRNDYHKRRFVDGVPSKSSGFEDGKVAFARCGRVNFPEPAGRNANMMPFIFGDKYSLPDDLQCYHSMIEQCPYMADEIGKVGYFTVHESYIDTGKAQRREGLHIESPGVFSDDPNASASFTPGVEHPWGMGICFGPDRYEGGIFMASSVANTSEVWDALVDNKIPGIVDRHGGCEHLRGILGEGNKLEAGELIWMTDCTPHEALPQEVSGYRQFFRVVTPYVSHWFAQHSTPNPKVPLPPHVTVIRDNKFENRQAKKLKVAS